MEVQVFDLSLRGRIADSHEAIQKIAQPNLARFVVQKIGFKDAVVPSSDFLLESDKRGTPPKSEKAAAFWRVEGAGRGVQPFLRKETCESKGKKIVGDSRIAKMDCHDFAMQNLAMTKNSVDCFGDESPRNDGLFDFTNRTCNYRFILKRSKF